MLTVRSAGIIIAIAAALNLGCGSKKPNDQSIVTDIQSKLSTDAVTKPAGIAVTAQNGVVTLSGNVPNAQVAQEAAKIANGVSGVRSVDNELTVNGVPASSTAGTNAPAGNVPPGNAPPNTNPQTAAAPPPQAAPAAPNPAGPPPAPPEPQFVTFPAGEQIEVRTTDAISSKTADPGTVYRASLVAPLRRNGRVIVPAGAPVSLVVVNARQAGRVAGQSLLEVRASAIDVHHQYIPINTDLYEQAGNKRGTQTAVRTGIGAVAGAIIGGIAGGGKGAAIGTAAGGGAGFGSNLFTRGQQVKIPSETLLMFRLEAPLRVPVR